MAAHHVRHRIQALPGGDLVDFPAQGGVVGQQDRLRPGLPGGVSFAAVANYGQRFGPRRPGDVESGGSHSAGGPVHRRPLPGLQAGGTQKTAGGGHVVGVEGGGDGGGEARRDMPGAVGGGDYFFGVGPMPEAAEHPVAGRESGVGGFGHFPGAFETGRERRVGPHLVAAFGHQQIGEVDPGRQVADAHPALLQRRRGEVDQPQIGIVSEFVHPPSQHSPILPHTRRP